MIYWEIFLNFHRHTLSCRQSWLIIITVSYHKITSNKWRMNMHISLTNTAASVTTLDFLVVIVRQVCWIICVVWQPTHALHEQFCGLNYPPSHACLVIYIDRLNNNKNGNAIAAEEHSQWHIEIIFYIYHHFDVELKNYNVCLHQKFSINDYNGNDSS